MNRFFCSLLLVFMSYQGLSQTNKEQKIKQLQKVQLSNDTLPFLNSRATKVAINGRTKYTDFKIISLSKDTSCIDTTLTIQKHYKFNFRRKDNFELLSFHNIGQTFNTLGYLFSHVKPQPDLGFRAKQFFYLGVDEIDYYDVPTPTSEIMFMTTLEQGQFLESFFTLNFSKRFNASIAYTGLRSLGKYRRSLVSQGNFRTTFRYESKEGQYALKGHIVTQDLLNEESGGLTAMALEAFETNDENFTDRARLDVNLNNTESFFKGSRVYVEHDYKLLASKDSSNQKNSSDLKVGHIFLTENKTFEFRQDNTTTFLGTPSTSGAINDGVESSFIKNQLFLEFMSNRVLGTFLVKSSLMSYSYGYNEMFNQDNEFIKEKLEGSGISFGADWKAKVRNITLDATGEITPGNSRLSGTHFKGNLSFKKDSVFMIKASLLLHSRSPNFNFLLHQSTYQEYNWSNNFENERIQNLGLQITSRRLNADLNLTKIENYAYFGENNLPTQAAENITYLKVRVSKEFRYKKFALDNTIMYQNVSSGSSVFRVPELVSRNTLYYSDYWFKSKPIYLQIGATLKYFTKYKANAYNPLLSEFTIQNTDEIGYPTLDVFFNAQVRRTRIYFRIDNLSSILSEKNYFSAPNYPYRDAVVRFGLVWNWFI